MGLRRLQSCRELVGRSGSQSRRVNRYGTGLEALSSSAALKRPHPDKQGYPGTSNNRGSAGVETVATVPTSSSCAQYNSSELLLKKR